MKKLVFFLLPPSIAKQLIYFATRQTLIRPLIKWIADLRNRLVWYDANSSMKEINFHIISNNQHHPTSSYILHDYSKNCFNFGLIVNCRDSIHLCLSSTSDYIIDCWLMPTYKRSTHCDNHWLLTLGANLLNSFTQFGRVDKGTTIRYGPVTFIEMICAIIAMHWTVFPSPISSAKMPFTPFSYIDWNIKCTSLKSRPIYSYYNKGNLVCIIAWSSSRRYGIEDVLGWFFYMVLNRDSGDTQRPSTPPRPLPDECVWHAKSTRSPDQVDKIFYEQYSVCDLNNPNTHI